MNFRKRTIRFLSALLLGASAAVSTGAAQVSGQVSVAAANGAARADRDVSVVFWLTPLTEQASPRRAAQDESARARLIQKNKVFDPHVLAVQVGSQVDFPNRDPYFHNVFSLFNGKRFDLGLYEAGSTRSVLFDRVGICYIFCNIHSQMSAVVVVVDTPYFAVSDARGEITIPRVPPGRYRLNFWEEHCAPNVLKELSRQVTVADRAVSLGNIHLQESNEAVTGHLNKYGKEYDPQKLSSPDYVQP
jgi:plastocyanin